MVRLVFRPYTQIRPSICTSERLRASTRVSSGFTLFRHSSPSFGSQRICSDSNLSTDVQIGQRCGLLLPRVTFIAHPGLPPKYLHIRWTPWSVFQDGSFDAISSARPSALRSRALGTRGQRAVCRCLPHGCAMDTTAPRSPASPLSGTIERSGLRHLSRQPMRRRGPARTCDGRVRGQ